MKYEINDSGTLIIRNDLVKTVFYLTKNNNWVKWEYDQNDEEIYYGRLR